MLLLLRLQDFAQLMQVVQSLNLQPTYKTLVLEPTSAPLSLWGIQPQLTRKGGYMGRKLTRN